MSVAGIPLDRRPAARARILLIIGVGIALAATVALIALSLREPHVAMYAPTPAAPHDVGRALVGPIVYTVDASRPEDWRYFAFGLGSVIDHPGPGTGISASAATRSSPTEDRSSSAREVSPI